MTSKKTDLKVYSTDGKVRHLSSEEDVNQKLIKIIGKNLKVIEIYGIKQINWKL